MKESGVREELSKRVEEMLRETKSWIMVGGEMGENFWMAREVRQGYPLSPLLVNVLIVDLEEAMGKVKWGGVKVGGERIYTLAYADDLVLLAGNGEEMRSMMERLEGYLERKRLELNGEKTKIMRGGVRMENREWR